MNKRCHYKGATKYYAYGAKGLTVPNRWRLGDNGKTGFECFLADMGPKPSPHHSINRINNNGHYEPANCAWSTPAEQAQNRRTTIKAILGGKTFSLKQAAKLLNTNYKAAQTRLRLGWPLACALILPPNHKTLAWKYKLRPTLAAHQDVEASIAEPATHGCELAQASPSDGIIRSGAAIADRAPIHSERSARPPFAHLEPYPELSDGLSPDGGRHHFFDAISFSIALSSIASASSFLSLAFSASSALSRLASDTSRPPYLAFHL